MKISKLKLNYNFSFLFLWLMILTIPLSLLFKVNFIGIEFSISYIFLIFFIFISIVMYLFFIKFELKFLTNKVFLLFSFSFLFLLCTNSFYNELDIKFLLFLVTFIFSFIVGYLYSKLIQNYFQRQFSNLIYILVLIGLILYYFNIPLFDFNILDSELYFVNSYGYYRLSSILLNPNNFAYMLLLYFTFYVYSKKKESIIIFSLVLAAFLLTESRSAFMGLLIIYIFYNYQYFKQKVVLNIISLIGIFLLFIFLLIFTNNDFLINYDIRFIKFSIALDYIFYSIEYFFFGVPFIIDIQKDGITFSDNMFLYLMLKMGFFAFFLFIFGYISSIFKASVVLSQKNNLRIKPFALFLISTLLPMFFSNLLLFSPIYILIAISIGVLEKEGVQ